MTKSGHESEDIFDNIRSLMEQHKKLNRIKSDVLELTQVVGEKPKVMPKQSLENMLISAGLDNNQLLEKLPAIMEPYLKSWMDLHLPAITKEIVEEQIKIIMQKSKE